MDGRPSLVECRHFDDLRCRSCSLLKVPRARQLSDKEAHARSLVPSPVWHPTIAGPDAGFRNKAKMVVGGTIELPTLGILDAAHRGVDLRDCSLHSPRLTAALEVVARFIMRAELAPYSVSERTGELKHVLLTESPDGELMLRFVVRSTADEARIRKHLPWLLAELPLLRVVSLNVQPTHAAVLEGEREIVLTDQSELPMRIAGLELALRPQGFFQTNTHVAAALYSQARDWVAAIAPASVWDLYCGVGGFALACTAPARSITGVEVSAEAVAAARQTAPEGVTFIAADATTWARSQSTTPDVVIVNPPRRGIGSPLADLLETSGVGHVIYSSCNAESLARDLARMPSLLPVEARVLDMFPHTTHYEVVVLLARRLPCEGGQRTTATDRPVQEGAMREELPAHPSSVGRARRLVREQLQGTDLEPLVETAELVVSEVVTNAIVHTGADIEVAASLDDDGLRVEVADSSTHLPVVASYDSLALTGRGLRLVAELTDQWGVETRPDGKTFWFHLGLSVRDEAPHDPEISGSDLNGSGRDGRGNDVTVELLNMPARMHEAWQEHAKSLLRDLLLLGIDVAASDELEAHAAAMDALAILEEQVGTGVPDPAPDPLARVPRTVKVRVVVPQDSVPHFETLDKQLDSALSLAHAGRLLAPPSQPEFDAFRRWIADQVREQAEGQPPRPWTAQAAPTGPGGLDSEHAAAWDAAAVTASQRALIGADRAGLIIATSPAALALLKYDGPTSLLGKKLADLVPTRHHRTHLAGFTLHQFNDRGPTLGLAVVVPVRRGDDTEAEVRLSLTASLGTDGASMFVMELQPGEPQGP